MTENGIIPAHLMKGQQDYVKSLFHKPAQHLLILSQNVKCVGTPKQILATDLRKHLKNQTSKYTNGKIEFD
jgi:hypothetical protein